jgi:hypothetical protein
MVRYDIITPFLFAFAFCSSSPVSVMLKPVPLTANCLIKTDHSGNYALICRLDGERRVEQFDAPISCRFGNH